MIIYWLLLVITSYLTHLQYVKLVFSISLLVRTHSKNEVTQKGGRDGASNKTVTRLRNFMEVPANTNSLLFSMLILRIYLESINSREERRLLLFVIIGVVITRWQLPYILQFKTFESYAMILSSFRYP